MHDPSKVGPVELATMGFGQSLTITPMQLLRCGAAIVNGGDLVTPHFGQNILDQDGNVTTTQHFFGLDEKTYFYDYSSVESIEELEKEATTKLKEIANKKVLALSSTDSKDKRLMSLEVGDVIKCVFPGGDIIDAPVIKKIYTVQNGNIVTQIK
jgi:membrane carboxypeptidase/penicillin-binding protein